MVYKKTLSFRIYKTNCLNPKQRHLQTFIYILYKLDKSFLSPSLSLMITTTEIFEIVFGEFFSHKNESLKYLFSWPALPRKSTYIHMFASTLSYKYTLIMPQNVTWSRGAHISSPYISMILGACTIINWIPNVYLYYMFCHLSQS